jgi:hypothetical protein
MGKEPLMIYLALHNGQRIIVIDSHNIDAMKKGEPVKTPDKHVMIAYTPDIGWLTEHMVQMGSSLDPERFDALLKEGLNRPIASVLPQHPHIDLLKKRDEA